MSLARLLEWLNYRLEPFGLEVRESKKLDTIELIRQQAIDEALTERDCALRKFEKLRLQVEHCMSSEDLRAIHAELANPEMRLR